jgi:hypothetical protein
MCLVFCSFVAVPLLAQGAFCNQFLVPVPVGQYSGVNGSLWSNELWIRNDSDTPRLVTQRECVADFHGCQDVSRSQTLPPRSTMKLIPLAGTENIVDGQFVYVDDPTAMFFGLRSRDMNTTSAGTSIPVVSTKIGRQRQQLLNVPIDSRYRYSLRIYVFDHLPTGSTQGEPQNRIRVYDSPSRALLIDQPALFNGFEDDSTCSGFPNPYQNTAIDPFAGQAGLNGKTVRIEIESDFYDFWAMLTITNNATNEVTAIVP